MEIVLIDKINNKFKIKNKNIDRNLDYIQN